MVSSLASLLDDTSSSSDEQVVLVDINKIVALEQVRSSESEGFTSDSLDDLKTSISSIGLQTPITLRPDDKGNYILVSGERRFRACKELGFKEIPSFIRSFNSDSDVIIYQLTENLQRVDLSIYEQAQTIEKLSNMGLSGGEISKLVGKKTNIISMLKSIASIPQFLLDLTKQGKVSSSIFVQYQLSMLCSRGHGILIQEYLQDLFQRKDLFDRTELDSLKRYIESQTNPDFNEQNEEDEEDEDINLNAESSNQDTNLKREKSEEDSESFNENSLASILATPSSSSVDQETSSTVGDKDSTPASDEYRDSEEESEDVVDVEDTEITETTENPDEDLETDTIVDSGIDENSDNNDSSLSNSGITDDNGHNDISSNDNTKEDNALETLVEIPSKTKDLVFKVIYQGSEFTMQLHDAKTCILKGPLGQTIVNYSEVKIVQLINSMPEA